MFFVVLFVLAVILFGCHRITVAAEILNNHRAHVLKYLHANRMKSLRTLEPERFFYTMPHDIGYIALRFWKTAPKDFLTPGLYTNLLYPEYR